MADLSIEFCGIKSPNPFWLASAPPTDKAYNVVRAFEAGWGGDGGTKLGPWVKEVKNAIPGAAAAVSVKPNSNGTSSTEVTVTIKWQRKAGDATNTSTMTSYLAKSS